MAAGAQGCAVTMLPHTSVDLHEANNGCMLMHHKNPDLIAPRTLQNFLTGACPGKCVIGQALTPTGDMLHFKVLWYFWGRPAGTLVGASDLMGRLLALG